VTRRRILSSIAPATVSESRECSRASVQSGATSPLGPPPRRTRPIRAAARRANRAATTRALRPCCEGASATQRERASLDARPFHTTPLRATLILSAARGEFRRVNREALGGVRCGLGKRGLVDSRVSARRLGIRKPGVPTTQGSNATLRCEGAREAPRRSATTVEPGVGPGRALTRAPALYMLRAEELRRAWWGTASWPMLETPESVRALSLRS
jgi:hypothetical protein